MLTESAQLCPLHLTCPLPFAELGSEDCNVLNMSIEAEMALEQMKEEHHRALCDLQQQLETTVMYNP